MTLTNKNILPLYFSSLSLCFFFLICMALCSMCRCGLQKRNRWMSVILWFYIYVLQFLLFINLIFAVMYQTSHPPFLQPDSLGGKKKGVIYHCAASGCLTHTCTHTHTEALGFIVPLWQMGCPLCTIGFDDALPLSLSLWNAHAYTLAHLLKSLYLTVWHIKCVFGVCSYWMDNKSI